MCTFICSKSIPCVNRCDKTAKSAEFNVINNCYYAVIDFGKKYYYPIRSKTFEKWLNNLFLFWNFERESPLKKKNNNKNKWNMIEHNSIGFIVFVVRKINWVHLSYHFDLCLWHWVLLPFRHAHYSFENQA